jgi:SAM-dependent methyltransferase
MLDLNKIGEIANGIDEHLRKLESFKGLLLEIKYSLEELKRSQEKHFLYELQQVKRDLADVSNQLKRHGLPLASEYEKKLQEAREFIEKSDWPEAVPSKQICDSPEKVKERAENLLDLFVGEHLKDKRFLDYGCGQGHTIPEALKREAAVAIGYDVNLKDCKFDMPNFVSNFEEVKKNAPFDIVLLHDVLDHIVVIDPIQALVQIKSVMSNKGRLYVRNHPWSSRHGGHLYLQKNKAFLHLIFDEVELARIGGIIPEHNIKVVTPIDTYRYWFKEAGFRIRSEIPVKDCVEEFFKTPSVIQDRLKKHWSDPTIMENHLEISFVEYVVEPEESNHQIF